MEPTLLNTYEASDQPEPTIISSELFSPVRINERLGRGTAAQIASIRHSLNREAGVEDLYTEALAELESAKNPQDVIDAAVSEFRGHYMDMLNKSVSDALTAPDALEYGLAAHDIMGETNASLEGPNALEIANILAVKGEDDRFMAEQLFYRRKIAEMTEDTGFWKTLSNFTGLLLPDWVWDTSDLTGRSMLTATHELERWIVNFQSLPLEERLVIFPYLQGMVLDAVDDNELKASIRLMQFLNPFAQKEIYVDAIIDAIDLAAVSGPLIKVVTRANKAYNPIRNTADAGDNITAARANAANIADESGAVEADVLVSREVSAGNATGFKFSDLIPEATDGIAADSQRVLDQISSVRTSVRARLEPTLNERNFFKESPLTPDEQALVQNKAIRDIDSLKNSYYENYGMYVDDAKIIDRTDDGFTVSYKVEGIEARKVVKYKIDDAGEFSSLELGAVETKIWSPSTWMDRLQKDVVEVATRIGFAQAHLISDLRDASRQAVKHLGGEFTLRGRESRKKIDSVLLSGDDAIMGDGKVYSLRELMYEGVTTEHGLVKLSGPEAASYYAIRDIYDSLHFMRNKITRDTLDLQGFREVALRGDTAVDALKVSVGRPYDSVSAIPEEILRPDWRLWNPQKGGGVVHSNTIDHAKMYDDGYRLVRFRKQEKIGDEYINYGYVKSDSISELRSNVIHKKTGYVPKVYQDGFYFVKMAGDAVVDGRKVPNGETRTLRIFDNKKDADAYAKSLSEKDPGGKYKYEVKHDRQMAAHEREEEFLAEAGGLFTSPRATTQLLFGLDGDKPRRISAFGAMDRNLQNIANHMPMNQFRMGLQQRWLNSAKPHLVTPGDFNSKITAEPGSRLEIGLRESRNWINDITRVPTEGDRRWEALTRYMAEWMEGKAILDSRIPLTERGSIRRGVMVLGSKDPYSSMRAAAFHALLGWFNPAQLFVQAQGASIAFSLDPLGAPRHIRQYMALRAGYHSMNNPKALDAVAKAAGMDTQEFKTLMVMFDKSGLMRSAKTTADHGASANSIWMGADALRRAADKGLIFFREGEVFTRGYAFLTAKDAYLKKTGKALKDLTDQDGKEIVTLTLKKMMNLNMANRAHWQKGLLGVPTQFMQIATKFIENMLPNVMKGSAKKFSGAEKGRIMFGQLALYGAAGIPLSNFAINQAASMAGFEPGEITPEWEAAVNDGFWGWMAQETFGVRAEIGVRGSLPSGIEMLAEGLLSADTSFGEAMLGAFGEVPSRAFRALRTLGPMTHAAHEIEWNGNEAITAFSSIASILSSYSNAHKAWMWYQLGYATDNQGKLLFEIDRNKDLNLIFTKALGFSPTKVSHHYQLKEYNANMVRFERDAATGLRILWTQYLAKDTITEQDMRNLSAKTKAALMGLTPVQQEKVRATVGRDLFHGRDKNNKVLREALRKHLDSGGQTTVGGQGIIFNTNLTAGE